MHNFSPRLWEQISCDKNDPRSCLAAMQLLWPLSLWMMKRAYREVVGAWNDAPPYLKKFLQLPPAQWLSRERGSCYVLFALRDELLSKAPYLRSAFPLPLLWREGQEHDKGLPQGLRAFADKILEEVRPKSRWGLTLNFGIENCDLSSWDLDCESGFAPLCAALLLAQQGGLPDPQVWASAAWDKDKGIIPVDHLESKMEAVLDFEGTLFFVPLGKEKEALTLREKWAGKRRGCNLEIRALPQGVNEITKALQPYLIPLDCPPDRSQPLTVRCEYYNRQDGSGNKDGAYAYYINYLVEDLAEECRKRGIQGIDDLPQRENLISFLGLNTGALLVLSIVQPKRVLLFYTKQSEPDLPKLEKLARQRNIHLEKVLLSLEDDEYEEDLVISETVQNFLSQYGAEKTILDVTPGPKSFSLIASWAVNPAITPCLYIDGQSWQKRRLTPGKERIRRLKKIEKGKNRSEIYQPPSITS